MDKRWAVQTITGVGAAGLMAAAALAQPRSGAQDDDTVLGIPAIVRGAPAIQQHSITVSETPVLLFHYFNVGADCEPTHVAFRITTPPGHGAVEFQDGEERPFTQGHPLFPADDPRSRCASRLVATKDAVYTPAAGFSGADSFVIEATEAGQTFSDTVGVSVLSLSAHLRVKTAK
jgi:hypothetical protein